MVSRDYLAKPKHVVEAEVLERAREEKNHYCFSLLMGDQEFFRQLSTPNFYVRKFCAQLFCAYVLGLYFTGARLLAQKLRVECW